jgi:hypothetical protein
MIRPVLIAGILILMSVSCTRAAGPMTAAPLSGSISTPAPSAGPAEGGTIGPATPLVPVTSGPTLTPEPTLTDLPPDCAKTAVTQLEKNRCAESDAHRAELKMDQLIVIIQNSLAGEQLDEFTTLQSRWEALMESLCGWEVGNIQAAPVSQLVFSTCQEQQYNDRIQELKLLLCPDRGLSGPCPASQNW